MPSQCASSRAARGRNNPKSRSWLAKRTTDGCQCRIAVLLGRSEPTRLDAIKDAPHGCGGGHTCRKLAARLDDAPHWIAEGSTHEPTCTLAASGQATHPRHIDEGLDGAPSQGGKPPSRESHLLLHNPQLDTKPDDTTSLQRPARRPPTLQDPWDNVAITSTPTRDPACGACANVTRHVEHVP
jgi:hypothetical protein